MSSRIRLLEEPWGRTWLVVLVVIPAMSLMGNQLLGGLRTTLGGVVVLPLLSVAIAGVAGCACYPVLRRGSAIDWFWLAVGAIAGLPVLLLIPPGPRWMHPVLFLPLGWASARVFDTRTAVLVVAAVGASDEGLQYSLDYRTGSVLDATANTLSGWSGMALARAARAGKTAR